MVLYGIGMLYIISKIEIKYKFLLNDFLAAILVEKAQRQSETSCNFLNSYSLL